MHPSERDAWRGKRRRRGARLDDERKRKRTRQTARWRCCPTTTMEGRGVGGIRKARYNTNSSEAISSPRRPREGDSKRGGRDARWVRGAGWGERRRDERASTLVVASPGMYRGLRRTLATGGSAQNLPQVSASLKFNRENSRFHERRARRIFFPSDNRCAG